jgi:hypothetical protein
MHIIEVWDRYNSYRCHYTLTGTVSECIIEARLRYMKGFYDDIFTLKVYQVNEDGTRTYIGRN